MNNTEYMIPKSWAETIANTQDIGWVTKKNFIRIMVDAPDDRSIDPISDIIINAVLDAEGDDSDKLNSIDSDLSYAVMMLTRAKEAINKLNV